MIQQILIVLVIRCEYFKFSIFQTKYFFVYADPHSDKELREAEETVLHHLNYCTQFKINEQQFSIVLRVR